MVAALSLSQNTGRALAGKLGAVLSLGTLVPKQQVVYTTDVWVIAAFAFSTCHYGATAVFIGRFYVSSVFAHVQESV